MRAKQIELRDDFKSKLGWLVGNIFSRVGTEDWTPGHMTAQEFKRFINDLLDEICHWTDSKSALRELEKQHGKDEVSKMNSDEISENIKNIKIHSRKEQILNGIENVLRNSRYLPDEAKQNVRKIILEITSDATMKGLIK